MKMKVFLILSVILIIVIASSSVMIHLENSDIHSLEGINEKGQTYGIGSDLNGTPDLVLAIGIDGTLGYVYKTDIDPPKFKTIEEALKWQEERKDIKTIPLYSSDGETVIGEFEMYDPATALMTK